MNAGRPVVVISGPIAAGKTSVTLALGDALDVPPWLEQYQRNPFLVRFYRNPRRWAFVSQLFFLVEAWLRHQKAQRSGGVLDGCLPDVEHAYNYALADQALIGSLERRILTWAYTVLSWTTRRPELVVLLEAPAGELLRRIDHRGRTGETAVTSDYLNLLVDGLGTFWRQSGVPCVVVDTTSVDARDPEGQTVLVALCRGSLDAPS